MLIARYTDEQSRAVMQRIDPPSKRDFEIGEGKKERMKNYVNAKRSHKPPGTQ
jgi:hypothetical protein